MDATRFSYICATGDKTIILPSSLSYRETGLFQSAGLFQSFTNFITVIDQRIKIIKLNHLYLYDASTDHI